MPLSITATAGSASANGFATVAEVESIAAYRPGGAAFIALTADQKVQAVATVTQDINSIAYPAPGQYGGFIGERATTTQALEWPRTGTDYTGLPAPLVAATIEYAILKASEVAAGTYTLDSASGLGNIKVEKTDVLSTEYFPGAAPIADALARFPRIVQDLLRSLVVVPATNMWGAGTASRGS